MRRLIECDWSISFVQGKSSEQPDKLTTLRFPRHLEEFFPFFHFFLVASSCCCTWKSKMSSHLNWMIIRDNNAFLLKKRNINKPFSTEANNLTNLSSYRYSGLVHRKSVGIVDTPDKKGFTVVYKKAKAVNKPAKANVKSTMKAGARRSLHKLKTLLRKNKYRVDLTKAALRRASAVLRSQKPLPTKKTRTTKKTD